MRVLRSVLLGASILSVGVVVSTGCAERPGTKKEDKKEDKKDDKADKDDKKKKAEEKKQ